MDIDFYTEIQYNLKLFRYIIKKRKLKSTDIEKLIVLISNINDLLETYLYDYIED